MRKPTDGCKEVSSDACFPKPPSLALPSCWSVGQSRAVEVGLGCVRSLAHFYGMHHDSFVETTYVHRSEALSSLVVVHTPTGDIMGKISLRCGRILSTSIEHDAVALKFESSIYRKQTQSGRTKILKNSTGRHKNSYNHTPRAQRTIHLEQCTADSLRPVPNSLALLLLRPRMDK